MTKQLHVLFIFCLVGAPCGVPLAGELPEDWNVYESDFVTVHSPPRADHTGRALSEEADAVVSELMALTGQERPSGPIHVYVAATRESFSTIQPREPPEWAAGTAYPDRNLIFLSLETHGSKTPRQVFVHEITHVVLHWSYGDSDPPRWLEEGLAQVVASEFDLRTQATLSQAALGGGLIPLRSLTRTWPSHPAKARIAYAESRDFVLFLRHRHGDQAIADLVRGLAAGQTVDDAVFGATGYSLDAIQIRWRSRLNRRYAWLPVIGGSGTFWGIAALLLVAGWVRKRRIKKRKLAQMGRREAEMDARRMDAWDPEPDRSPLWEDPLDGPPTVH